MSEDTSLGLADYHVRILRFGPFELDPRAGELRKRGRKILLQEQPFQILLMLLEKPGDVVLREEIRKKLWPNDTFVQFAPSINAAIQRLREALGDSAEEPRYVETVARRGYRLCENIAANGTEIDGGTSKTEFARGRLLAPLLAERGKALKSIAVLPFDTAGRDPDGEYLSQGITENIINCLSKITTLRVTPRSTVFRYKRKGTDPQTIGHELKVDVVLVGRVGQRDGALVVSTELVDVARGSQLWGERYNRKLSDLFEVEEEIARRISESLRVKLSGEEEQRLAKRFTENSEAYQFYLRGRYFWNKRTPDSIRKGYQYFQQAIDRDAGYALAYSGLADCYTHLCMFGVIAPKEARARAKAAAAAAVALDPELAEAHASLALVRAFADWDWENSDRESEQAAKLDAGYWAAPYWHGVALAARGRYAEAVRWTNRALELEPLSPVIAHGAAFNLIASRRYADAVSLCLKAIDIAPDYPLLKMFLGIAYEQESRYQEAIAEFEKMLQILGGEPVAAAALAHAYAGVGRHAEAREILQDLLGQAERRYVDSYSIALIYVALGEHGEAIDWLYKAAKQRDVIFTYMANGDPRLDGLRSDLRFETLLGLMRMA